MNRREIVTALTALGEVLDRRGVQGEMYVVGGAAIALAYDSRRSTRDIDGVFEPKAAVYEAAGEVAEALLRPPGWLNDAVKGFLAGNDPEAAPVLDVPGLRCLAASPGMLLALKVLAHRVGEDEEDVLLLAPDRACDRERGARRRRGGLRRPVGHSGAVLRGGALRGRCRPGTRSPGG